MAFTRLSCATCGDSYGPAQGYRLVVREASPGLTLFAAQERSHLLLNQAAPGVPVLAPGHRAGFRVIAVRSGADRSHSAHRQGVASGRERASLGDLAPGRRGQDRAGGRPGRGTLAGEYRNHR